MVKKVHPIPAFALCGLVGLLLALTVQGCDLKTLLSVAYNGVKTDTGAAEVNALLQRGGFNGMLSVMALYIGACTFTTILDASGARAAITEALLKKADSNSRLLLFTLFSALIHLLGLGDAQVACYLNGSLLSDAYAQRGLDKKVLSRASCDICTNLSPLIPWTTCGLYVAATLGTGCLPLCVFNIVGVVIAVALAIAGNSAANVRQGKE